MAGSSCNKAPAPPESGWSVDCVRHEQRGPGRCPRVGRTIAQIERAGGMIHHARQESTAAVDTVILPDFTSSGLGPRGGDGDGRIWHNHFRRRQRLWLLVLLPRLVRRKPCCKTDDQEQSRAGDERAHDQFSGLAGAHSTLGQDWSNLQQENTARTLRLTVVADTAGKRRLRK